MVTTETLVHQADSLNHVDAYNSLEVLGYFSFEGLEVVFVELLIRLSGFVIKQFQLGLYPLNDVEAIALAQSLGLLLLGSQEHLE